MELVSTAVTRWKKYGEFPLMMLLCCSVAWLLWGEFVAAAAMIGLGVFLAILWWMDVLPKADSVRLSGEALQVRHGKKRDRIHFDQISSIELRVLSARSEWLQTVVIDVRQHPVYEHLEFYPPQPYMFALFAPRPSDVATKLMRRLQRYKDAQHCELPSTDSQPATPAERPAIG